MTVPWCKQAGSSFWTHSIIAFEDSYLHELVGLLMTFVSSDFDLQSLCLSPELLNKLLCKV